MKRPTKSRPPRKSAAHKPASQAGIDAVKLADRIASAPRLSDKKSSSARVAGWFSELSSKDAKPIEILLRDKPVIRTLLEGLAESSPYLWDLASREPARLLRLLQADPDSHFRALLSEGVRAVATCKDELEAMRLLRRMKSEAALLIALADIGGVWPIMRAARALTDLADTAVDAAVQFCLAEAARVGKLVMKDTANSHVGSGYIVLAMGKMGAFELNYSSDIDLIVLYDLAASGLTADAEPSTLFVRITQRLVKLLQERTADGYVFRTDLRLRPDPASTAIAISTEA